MHTTTIKRYGTSIAAAGITTACLLVIMTYAIDNKEIDIPEPPTAGTLDWLPIIDEPAPELTQRKPPPPPPVDRMPPVPQLAVFEFSSGGGHYVPTAPTANPGPINGTGFNMDGDPLPIVTVAPEYPDRAASKGVEGWVIVEFTIDALGRVQAPVIVEGQPARVFDRAALNAVKRYKYKPRVINGEAVPVNRVRQRITFELS